MTLFEIALDYALFRSPGWGRLLVCLRARGDFSYRGYRQVPVISVPRAEADGAGLALLAYLFGQHAARVSESHSSLDSWIEAEAIYADLCVLARLPHDAHAFHQQRHAFLGAVVPTGTQSL